MLKIDGRKLAHKTLEELRIRTVLQVESREHPERLAEALGLNRSTIYKWLQRKVNGGDKALEAQPISGRPPVLNDKHLKWLCGVLTDKTPQQMKLVLGLWTRDQVIEVVYRRFSIKLSKTGVSRVLDRLGFTFQKPSMRFKQQDPIIVSKWLATDFPAIRAEAKTVGAEIFFGDEAGVSSQYSIGKTIGKRGKTPIVQRTTKRFRVNMLSAVSLSTQNC